MQAPDATVELVADLVRSMRMVLGESFVGAYAHGSLTMGCFNPLASDLDLLVVTTGEVGVSTRAAVGAALVELAARAPAKGIELSVVDASVLEPFVYPTPYILHFSEEWRPRWARKEVDLMHDAHDPDLAAHVTTTRARGSCLAGAPIDLVFGAVPLEHYLDSIMRDARDCLADLDRAPAAGPIPTPVYAILNLCRVGAVVAGDDEVLSKAEGGHWALVTAPTRATPVIRSAVAEYAVVGTAPSVDGRDLARFAEWARSAVP